MSQSVEFYNARANEAAIEASKATLENVRDKNLRAEKTWRKLADQARRVILERAKSDKERDDRRAAELASPDAE